MVDIASNKLELYRGLASITIRARPVYWARCQDVQ
jgi:hypothetical protein